MGIYRPTKILPVAIWKSPDCPSSRPANGHISNRCAFGRPPGRPANGHIYAVEPPVDRAWNQRATALWPVNRPVDRNWIQRAELSAGRPASRPGPFPESRALWTVDCPVDRPTSPWLRSRLCTSVDWTGRPTSASNSQVKQF